MSPTKRWRPHAITYGRLPTFVAQQTNRYPDGCWVWNGASMTVRDPDDGGRERDVRRLVYTSYFPNVVREPLYVVCHGEQSEQCINPNAGHVAPWTRLTIQQQVAAILARHVGKAVEIEDGLTHWLWNGGDERPRIWVNGRNVDANIWLYRNIHPRKLKAAQKLVQRVGRCTYNNCVNPDCFSPQMSFTRLYRNVDGGERTPCHIGRAKPNKDGYVPYAGSWLHLTRFKYVNGPPPKGYEVHHVCNQHACCNPQHLRALTKEEHRALKENGVEVFRPFPQQLVQDRRNRGGFSSAEWDALHGSYAGAYDKKLMDDMAAFKQQQKKRVMARSRQ